MSSRPGPALRFRPIRAADDAAVARIIRTVMPEFGASGPGFAILDPEVDHMTAAYAGPRSAYFVVEREDGTVVGGGGYGPLAGGAGGTCELRKMYFLREARGAGVGRALLLHCLEAARAHGFDRCYLETLTGMDAAQRLYERLGFRRLARQEGATGHFGCNRFYELALQSHPPTRQTGDSAMKLIIGNKNYSSWSLRPWLALKHTGAAFEEHLIGLDLPTTAAEIARVSPSGKVPALQDGDVSLWDSLSICEYLNEKFPAAQLWPREAGARAVARSVSAEMHSGFAALREHLPMRMKEDLPGWARNADVERDVARIVALWADCRRRFGQGGPFLFGAFSIADAMYAPVVSRFRTYHVPLPAEAQAYAKAIWALPAMQEWEQAARTEELRVKRSELPAR